MERIQLYRGAFAHPSAFDMLVVMGGSMSVADEALYPWLPEEKRFIADAVARGAIVLGVCLGAQLLAEALGGSVERGPVPEIGWYPVHLTDAGAGTTVLGKALPGTFEAFHWHGDVLTPPPGIVLAAESDACPAQAFELAGGRVVGLQFHLELTPEGLEDLIAACGDELDGGLWVQPAAEMFARRDRFAEAGALLFGLLDTMTVGADGAGVSDA